MKQEKIYYSVHRNYATTYFKNVPNQERIRVEFANHVFKTDNEELQKAMDKDIEDWKDRHQLPKFQTIDEHERAKAMEMDFVVIEGVTYSKEELKKLIPQKEEPKVEIKSETKARKEKIN